MHVLGLLHATLNAGLPGQPCSTLHLHSPQAGLLGGGDWTGCLLMDDESDVYTGAWSAVSN